MSGPHPADTMFHERRARATTTRRSCMYHDQALIPLKALHFDDGVNVTLACRSSAPRPTTAPPSTSPARTAPIRGR